MSTPDLLGAFAGDFMKSSLDCYCKIGSNLRYVGKTDPGVSIKFPYDFMKFESGTPRALYITDFLRVGLEVETTIMQVCDPNLLSIVLNQELDTTGAYDYVFGGSDPGAVSSTEWRWVGTTRDGRLFELVVRKGMLAGVSDWGTGGDDYSRISFTIAAVQDTSISDVSRDMFYFRVAQRTFS